MTRSGRELARVLRTLATFAAIFSIIWLGLYELQNAFPYFQTGSDVIFQVKLRRERMPHLFTKPDAIGVLFFGNSKALSGFEPDLFDAAMEAAGRRTESYNLGLPGYNLFVDRLEEILAAGNIPKYIIVTVPWAPDEGSFSVFHFVRHDSQVIDELFPFRHLPRDLMLSALSALNIGDARNSYANNRNIANRMLADRGFYSVHDTWNFPSGTLPIDFHDSRDRPHQVFQRWTDTRASEFKRMLRLLEQYNLNCLMVPLPNRVGQMAPPPSINAHLAAELAPYPQIKLLGPDYILYENRYFADQAHLNPDGARLYTRYIADLVAPALH